MRRGRFGLMAGVLSLAAIAPPTHAATITIVMDKLVISPGAATAKVGDTIEWVNKDVVAHTATAKNGDFDVMIPPQKTVTYVLKNAGTVDYYCRFHPNMKATLEIDGEASP
jgi:plastocyanin